jgi:hypothetical protein
MKTLRLSLTLILALLLCWWVPGSHIAFGQASAKNFNIVTVRVEKVGAAPDWQLVHPPVRQVVINRRFTAALYATVKQAPPGTHIGFNLSIVAANGNTLINSGSFQYTIPSAPSTIRYTFTVSGLPKLGKYRIDGRATLFGQTLTRSAVIMGIAHPAPPPQLVSFSVMQLQTVSGDSNKPQRVFGHNQPVGIALDYSVQGVSGVTTVLIIKTYQYLSKDGWRPAGHPNSDQFDAGNGLHHYTLAFTPQDFTGPLRIVVGVTIGRRTETRLAQVQILSI